MHCNYTVLNKISETCYPPSLFGKSLPELVYMGLFPGVEITYTPDEPDVLDAGYVQEGLGVVGWRRLRRVSRDGRVFFGITLIH